MSIARRIRCNRLTQGDACDRSGTSLALGFVVEPRCGKEPRLNDPRPAENQKVFEFTSAVTKVVTALLIINSVGTRQTNDA